MEMLKNTPDSSIDLIITDPPYEICCTGGAVRAILELAGVKDVLAKSLGAANAANVAKATFKAISSLSTREQAYAKRGLSVPAKATEAN